MPAIGPFELIIVLVLAMMIFGAGKLPEVGEAIGKGIAEFRRGVTGKAETPPPEGSEKQES